MIRLLLASLLVAPVAAHASPEGDPPPDDAAAEEEPAPEPERDGEPLVMEVGLAGFYAQDRSTGRVTASLLFPSDAFLRIDGRVHSNAVVVPRLAAGVDVLGGGRAHLVAGVFAGAELVDRSGKIGGVAQGGGLVGVGYDDAHVGLGWEGRLGVSRVSPFDVFLENEVRLSWHAHPRFSVDGTWMRLDGPTTDPEDHFGVGVRVRF